MRLSEPQTQEVLAEKSMLLRLLRRFLEGLHFCDSGSPPLPKVSESSVSDTVEPLSDGEDCAKASMEISKPYSPTSNVLRDAFVFDNEETAIQILERAQWNSVEFTKKVVGELFRFIQSLAAKIVRAMKQGKLPASKQSALSIDGH